MTDIRKISETPYNSNTEQINKYVYKKYKIIPILKTEIDKENDIIILEIEHIDFILNTSFDLKDEIEKLIRILLEKLDKLLKNDKKLNKNNIKIKITNNIKNIVNEDINFIKQLKFINHLNKQRILKVIEQSLIDYKEGSYKAFDNIEDLMKDLTD